MTLSHTRSAVPFGFGLVVGVLAFGCAGQDANLPPPPPPPPPLTASATPPPPPPATTEAQASPPPPAMPPVHLVAGSASPDPTGPLPTARIASPTAGQVIPAAKAGEFPIKLDVKNWPTHTGGPHVHLILDGRPYKPIYDTKKPVTLAELTTGEPLAEGQHVLIAFPSRANHESVKTKGALAITSFYVGKKAADSVDIKKPLLIYSRPKGDYKGDMANHVLIDFQLANTELAEGKNVVNIGVVGPDTGSELTAKAAKFGTPFYLDNLRGGAYTVRLELVGADGKQLPGDWNVVTRSITVDRDAAPDAPAAAPAEHDHGPEPAKTPEPAKPAPKPTPKKK